MRILRKTIIVVLMIFSCITLTSCAKKSKITVIEEDNGSPIYLSFFSIEKLTNTDVIKYWSDAFTKAYKRKVYIKVELAKYYEDNNLSYRELLLRRLKSSMPDDMYIINAEDVIEFGEEGYWMDLSGMDFINNLSEAALYQSTFNDKVFSVPLSFTGFGFLWNLDILNRLKLNIPTNYTEFINVCEKMKNAGILPYAANKGYSLTVPAMGKGLSSLYGSQEKDEKIASLNSGETLISKYMHEGFDFLKIMIDNKYMDPVQAINTTPRVEDMEMFLNGECGFICVSLGETRQIKTEFKWEFTGLPILDNGSISIYGADNRLCINPNSKHLDVVKQFIEMVGKTESLEMSSKIDNTLSSTKLVHSSKENEKKFINLILSSGQIPNQDFSLKFNTWESIRDVSRELCNGLSIEEVCALLNQKQLEELNSYKNI